MRLSHSHETFDREEAVQGGTDRSFGVVFSAVFLILGLWPPLRHGLPVRGWMLAVSAALLAIAILRPSLLHPANAVWRRVGLLMQKVVNPVVTAVMYYAVFTPMACLLRLCGKDLLALRREPGAGTYWIVRNPPGPEPESMKRQF